MPNLVQDMLGKITVEPGFMVSKTSRLYSKIVNSRLHYITKYRTDERGDNKNESKRT